MSARAHRELDLKAIVTAGDRHRLRRRRQPTWFTPMLATLTEDYFSDPSWVFEPKLDGVRCLAFKDGPRVRLLSRNRLPLNERYPEIARAISSIEHDQIVLDGEAAVVSSGITRFQSLQRHLLQDAPLDASSFSPSISCTSMGTTSRGSRC